jgi:ABC-type phosphate transport system auxiliary subunit
MANGKVTNVDIFDRLERLRLELSRQIDSTSRDHKAELGDLRRQFEVLEAGRLTALERRMNDFVIAQAGRDAKYSEVQATLSTKFVIIGVIALAVLYGLIDAFARKVIK